MAKFASLDATIAAVMAEYQSPSWANWHSMPVRKYDAARMALAVTAPNAGIGAARNRSMVARNANNAYWTSTAYAALASGKTGAVSTDTLGAIMGAIQTNERAKTSTAIANFHKLSPQEVKALSPEARKAYDTARKSANQQASRERKRMGA